MRDGKLVAQIRAREVEVPVSQSVPIAEDGPQVDMDIPIPDVRVPIREFIPARKVKVPETERTPEPEVNIPAGMNIHIPVVDRDFIVIVL